MLVDDAEAYGAVGRENVRNALRDWFEQHPGLRYECYDFEVAVHPAATTTTTTTRLFRCGFALSGGATTANGGAGDGRRCGSTGPAGA